MHKHRALGQRTFRLKRESEGDDRVALAGKRRQACVIVVLVEHGVIGGDDCDGRLRSTSVLGICYGPSNSPSTASRWLVSNAMGEPKVVEGSTSSLEQSAESVLAMRIHAFSNMISGHYYGRSELVFGVNLSEWRVLQAVLGDPGTTQVEIATAQGFNVMNVSRAVSGLRRKGLLESRTDPKDARRSLLRATSLGEEIGIEIADRAQIVYESVFSVLDDSEIEVLDELLGRVTTRLRDVELPDVPAPRRDWAAHLGQNGDSRETN